MDPRRDLQRTLRALVMATIVAYLSLVCLGIYVYVDSRNSREQIAEVARDSNQALCSLRDDLERRIASSQAFLVANPEGVPGIPAKLIQDGIDNQQRTVDALGGLDCGPLRRTS
jgi:hypothetical protein